MNTLRPGPRTIGFLSTWSVFAGTAIDHYTRTLLEGICAAARAEGCHLLLACGIGLPGTPRGSRTAWAAPGPTADFVPVGPWNSDGLIIIPDDFSDAQFHYVQDLIRTGFPLVLTTTETPGPAVAVDNAGGIRQAIEHLVQHGHRQIAFVAGKSGRGGDSAERLAAYRAAVREWGLAEDERLIAFGEHRREDGRAAMQRILAANTPFTAVLASNDLSALGAMDALRRAGRRMGEDVAVIGFDDILDARSHLPPLTTVRHPTFALGYQAVLSLLARIENGRAEETVTRVPTRLVIRQSCGCGRHEVAWTKRGPARAANWATEQAEQVEQAALAGAMAEAALIEVQHATPAEVETHCLRLVAALRASLLGGEAQTFDGALLQLIEWLEAQNEDAYAWQSAFSTLRAALPDLLASLPAASTAFAHDLIDHARLQIAKQVQHQAASALLRHMELSDRLGLMTSQLLTTLQADETAQVLTNHLPQLGLQHVLVALYAPSEDAPCAEATVLLDAGLSQHHAGARFATHEFPPREFYPPGAPLQLTLLPFIVDEQFTGFAALSASDLDACAAIVHNLAAAVRLTRLYQQAVEGRRLAEEANRLKSRFLSMVSHELRVPLSLIVGLSDMVIQEQREKPELAGVTLRDIEQIHTSAQHLARLIGDVLDLASSEARQLRILREPLDLAEVLRVAAGIGEQMAQEKGLAWRAHLPAAGPWISGDRTRLRQVALNLLSNAVKFTPAPGRVALAVTVNEGTATVAVSDTGIGILPTDQTQLFREFQRAERSVQGGYGGLGLGLAISKQLVEQHSGVIGVRSPGDLGGGSTFFFTLPVMVDAAPYIALTLPTLGGSNRVVILAAQDETASPLSSFLRRRGFETELCPIDDAGDWPARVMASSPLAAILDRDLAARKGWGVISLLKRLPAAEHLPILLYALDPEHDGGEMLELNLFQKPLHAEQLAQALARYSEGGAAARCVLVADDDPGTLELHCRLAERAGCRALRARNGREALDVISRTRPDLILLDLMMPVMDGFAVLDALRHAEATRDIPVLVLTARVLSDEDVERLSCGVTKVLNKGLFGIDETLRHIEAALARQRSLGSPTQRLVRRAMAYIQSHYAEPLSREEIAAHAGISADYLTDCFRQELGVTPVVYLNRYRLLRARELLANTDLKITQIALAAGFTESAHFTRMFQRETGVSPRAYRQGKRAIGD